MSVEKAEWLFARLLHIEATIFRLKKVFIFEILGFSLQSCLGGQQVKKVNLKSFQFEHLNLLRPCVELRKKSVRKKSSPPTCAILFSVWSFDFSPKVKDFEFIQMPSRKKTSHFLCFECQERPRRFNGTFMSAADIYRNKGICDAAYSHVDCVERKKARKCSKKRCSAKFWCKYFCSTKRSRRDRQLSRLKK